MMNPPSPPPNAHNAEWIEAFRGLIMRFEQPATAAEWKRSLPAEPVCFGVYLREFGDVAGIEPGSREAIVVRLFEAFPPYMWMIGGVDYMLGRIATGVGSHRGAGIPSGLPELPGHEMVAVGVICAENIPSRQEVWFASLYAVDVQNTVYRRRRLRQVGAITEYRTLHPDDKPPAGTSNDPWGEWLDARSPMTQRHVLLGRILAACQLAPERCAQRFGPPALTGDQQKVSDALSCLSATFDMTDPRHPTRAN